MTELHKDGTLTDWADREAASIIALVRNASGYTELSELIAAKLRAIRKDGEILGVKNALLKLQKI